MASESTKASNSSKLCSAQTFYVALVGAGLALMLPGMAWAQLPATFVPDSLPITGLNKTIHITVNSPYDDCTMAISTTVSPAGFVTVDPPGPLIGLGPFTFAVTSGTKTGSGTLIFLISGTPGGCVNPTQYNIPVTIKDVSGGTPPTGTHEKQVVEPISMAKGALINGWVDLQLRGPLPLSFSRYYYSNLATEGQVSSALGTNWMHNFDLSLKLTGATAATVNYFEGEVIAFTNSGSAWTLSATDGLQYQLIQSGSFYKMLDPSSQLVYTFDGTSGKLQTINDRNGNTQTLTYSNNLLSHIADGLGGTLDFTYAGSNLTKVTDQAGRSISFAYTQSNLTSFTDATGKTTTYAYGSGGLMTSSTAPRGNIPYTQAYDPTGKVVSQTDAAGNITKFAINTDSTGSGASTMTDPLGEVSQYTQTARNLNQEIDPAGDTTNTTYDASNRPLTVTDASGNVTTLTWHQPTGQIAATINADGGQTSYTYSSSTSNGFTFYDLSSISYPDGTTESFQNDANGNVVVRVMRTGQQWKSTYNSHGQVLTMTSPTGAVTTFTYTQEGASTPASVQYADTSVTALTFDGLKRLLSRKNSDSTSVSYTWDANDHLLTSTDENGAITTYAWDANGKNITVTDPDGGTTKLTYTGTDKVATVTDPSGRSQTFAYDSVDRASKVTFPDSSTYQVSYDLAGNQATFTDGAGKTWKSAYSKTKVMTSVTPPLGGTINFTLDSMNRPVSSVTGAGKTNAFAYDKMGRLTAVTDSLQHQSLFSYDKEGSLIGVSIPGGISTKLVRDAAERITSVTDPSGNAWNMTWDGSNRILSTTDPLNHTTTYGRDARGRLSRITLPLGSLTLTLDAVGRLTHSAYSDGAAYDYAWDPAGRLTSATGLTFQYDASGSLLKSNGLGVATDNVNRVSQVTLAAGKSVSYTYDLRGLVTQVSDWLNGNTVFKYDDNSRLTSVTRPNGVVTTWTYDLDGDVTGVQENAGSTQLSSIALTRDVRGFVSQATRSVPLVPTAAQLTAAQTFHTYDAADQIAEFRYDAMGRRISDDTRSYTWDLASHLTGYTAGSNSASLTWNALDLPASLTQGAVTRQLVWNFAFALPSVSVTRTASGDLSYYVHTPDGKLLYSVDASGARHFYHFDEMGNTLFLTDGTGTITDKYAYTDYGAQVAVSGTTDNPFQYSGRDGVIQLGDGLSLNRLRVYDAKTASFLSRDSNVRPLPRLINPYEYAAGNPLLFKDPVGADPGNGATGSDLVGNASDLGAGTGQLDVVLHVDVPIVINQQDIPYDLAGKAQSGPLNAQPLNGYNFASVQFPYANGGKTEPQILVLPGMGPLGLPSQPGQPLALTGGTLTQFPVTGFQSGPVNVPAPGPLASGPVTQTRTETKPPGGGTKTNYADVVIRINNLYKKGKITAVQKNRMLLWAKFAAEDAQ